MDREQKPLIDVVGMEILMHRNAHFGSKFDIMLDYYHQQGIGVMPDFSIEQIKKLKHLEEETGRDLVEAYLPDAAKKTLAVSQKLYQKLRDVYAEEQPDELAIKLSDLILAEEDIPEKEISALVDQGSEAVPLLIELLKASSFYDPLFPGYGRSPIFAARALSQIGDERAIAPLFEALRQDNFLTDEEIIRALASFGDRALDFLFQRLKQKPLSKDNKYAAIVLNAFPETETIAQASLELLESDDALHRKSFASCLIFNCPGLESTADRERFRLLAKDKKVPRELIDEMAVVIKSW
ncbi:MAG: HEAT repeat domain-containing protein [Chlamydiota bacterium]